MGFEKSPSPSRGYRFEVIPVRSRHFMYQQNAVQMHSLNPEKIGLRPFLQDEAIYTGSGVF